MATGVGADVAESPAVRLRARRATLGLTVAAAAGIDPAVWSAYETATRTLPDAEMSRLSAAIGFRPSTAVTVHRDQILTLCRDHRTRAPRIFGSIARGTDTSDSDIDLLVDALPGTGLFTLIHLEWAIEALCGTDVDLITDGGLPNAPAAIRASILADCRPLPLRGR